MNSATKKLLLMRHAKSDWSDGSIADHDRPLNLRGQSSAPKVALWLASQDLIPEVILCSTSVRTTQTLALMMNEWRSQAILPGSEPDVHYMKELYLASASILMMAASQHATRGSVLVLAHNPGMEDAVSMLCGVGTEMPTAAVAVLDTVDEGWPKKWLEAGGWKLRSLVKPRDLDH